jgi:nucleoside-diphosphate-sugar epimerase
MQKRILVTGATGFIGRHLVLELLKCGYTIRAMIRTLSYPISQVQEQISVDLFEDVNWTRLLTGVDVVIHLAAIAHTRGVPKDNYDRVNWKATANLAKAAHELGVRFIFMSSVAAQVGPTCDRIVSESDPPHPQSDYGRSKLEAERDIAALGGPYIIFRPTLVYGHRVGGNMRSIINLAKLPVPLPFGAMRNLRSMVAIENLVSAVILVLQREDIVNQLFLVADAEPISILDLLKELRRGLGRRANMIPIPQSLLAKIFKVMGMSDVWLRLGGTLVVSCERLNRIGYSPAVRTKNGFFSLGVSEREVFKK